MINLCEYEMGFDASEIGFPSIANCRAVVLVTSGGLIGFHLAGTFNGTKQTDFVNFVKAQPHAGAQRALYIVSKVGTHSPTEFPVEAKSIATALKFKGPLYVGDVTSFGGRGLYVVFVDVGHNTCAVTARAWDDAVDSQDHFKIPYVAAGRAVTMRTARTTMFTNLNTAGMKAVYPTALA